MTSGCKDSGLHQQNRGNELSTLYNRTGVKGYLDPAILSAHKVVEATPMGHPDRAGLLNHLANCTFRVATLSGLRSGAEETSWFAQELIDTAPKDDWRHQMYLTNLGNTHSDTYNFSRNVNFGRLTLDQKVKNDTIS